MYKVLALDLDGTVLSDDHTIHPQVKDAIRAAQQHCMRLTPFTKLRVTLSLYGNLSSKVYQARLSDS